MKLINKSILLIIISLLVSCASLKYEPLKTPLDLEEDRKAYLSTALKEEFAKKNITYNSIDFTKSTVIKPSSYYKLDSLYEVKYRLERRNSIDRKLEQLIENQKAMVSQDSTPIYYNINHVFTTMEGDESKTVFAKVIGNKNNELQTIEIFEIVEIPTNLARFYAYYCFNESFVYPKSAIDEAELAFYDFYKEKLGTLEGNEKNKFLKTMLQVMKIANETKNLDKTNLIEFMVLYYLKKSSIVSVNDQFEKIEEQTTSDGSILYAIDFNYQDANFKKNLKLTVILDNYLNLIEVIERN